MFYRVERQPIISHNITRKGALTETSISDFLNSTMFFRQHITRKGALTETQNFYSFFHDRYFPLQHITRKGALTETPVLRKGFGIGGRTQHYTKGRPY